VGECSNPLDKHLIHAYNNTSEDAPGMYRPVLYFYPHFTKRSPSQTWTSCPRASACQGTAESELQGTGLLNIAGEKIGCSGILGHLTV